MFKDILRQMAASLLHTASKALPDPATRTGLDYSLKKTELARIFRLHSTIYEQDDHSRGLEVRTLAGHPPGGNHDTIHGFGDTYVLRGGKQLNLYVNQRHSGVMSGTGGIFSGMDNAFKSLMRTLRNIPTILIRARNPDHVLTKAANLDPVGRKCEQSIVARTTILAADPKKLIFALQADYMDDKENDTVVLRHIFRPVVDSAGSVTSTQPIDPSAPDADLQILRFLIFCKMVTDQLCAQQPVDIMKNLAAAEALPLDSASRLRNCLPPLP